MNQDMATFIAPLTLLLGGGLFAAGALSFLDIHFFKTKFGERAALAGGLALIVLTEFIFASSNMSARFFNGQRNDVLECRLAAETALPDERSKSSVVMHDHIVGCMNGLGYEWTARHSRCQEGPVATNPFCYLPVRPFDRIVTELQIRFE
ncbi:MAG: hypothetical protein HYS06_08615 [Methylocystis sp.]|nr:hypothetical protein [Methylocystis sp.]MBI3275695.1 hypothetical protein [Methylocystis sp.]